MSQSSVSPSLILIFTIRIICWSSRISIAAKERDTAEPHWTKATDVLRKTEQVVKMAWGEPGQGRTGLKLKWIRLPP